MTALLEVDHVACRYAGETVVNDVSFTIAPGEVACLLGPSGSGKTTLLRAIAGLHDISAGTIALRGNTVSSKNKTLPPEKRDLSMVFQDHALFPHMNVAGNVAFGLRGSAKEKRDTAVGWLHAVGLDGFTERYPHELSGGQQQRVALARALAPQPDLILFDEPFASLDLELKQQLGRRLHDTLREHRIAGIVVTHDQHEAFALADVVGVMKDGRIRQWDTPYRVYHRPADRFVAGFVGEGRLIPGRLLDDKRIETGIGTLNSQQPIQAIPGATMDVLIRPDDLVASDDGALDCMITQLAFRGADTLYTVMTPDQLELLTLLPSHSHLHRGDRLRLGVDAQHVVAFPAQDSLPAEPDSLLN